MKTLLKTQFTAAILSVITIYGLAMNKSSNYSFDNKTNIENLPKTNLSQTSFIEEHYLKIQSDSPQNTPIGFTHIEVNQISDKQKQCLSNNAIRIKMMDNNLNESKAKWEGFGTLSDKETATVSVKVNSTFCKGIKEGELYTIQFSEKPFTQSSVWMIIICKMQSKTLNKNQQTIIGEVKDVWIKKISNYNT